MISKQQLLSGATFKFSNLKYQLVKDDDANYIRSIYTGYVGNVVKIGTKSFTLYTYVMNRKVTVKVNYSDCELVD
jgi:hypothetical protein